MRAGGPRTQGRLTPKLQLPCIGIKILCECWSQNAPQIAAAEREAAARAYEEARVIYRRILAESSR